MSSQSIGNPIPSFSPQPYSNPRLKTVSLGPSGTQLISHIKNQRAVPFPPWKQNTKKPNLQVCSGLFYTSVTMIYFISSLADGFIQGDLFQNNERFALVLKVKNFCFTLRATRSKTGGFEKSCLTPASEFRKHGVQCQSFFYTFTIIFTKYFKRKSARLNMRCLEIRLLTQQMASSLGMEISVVRASSVTWGHILEGIYSFCKMGIELAILFLYKRS